MLLSDKLTPCQATFHRPLGTSHGNGSSAAGFVRPENGQCIIQLLGNEVNTASFAMYTFSISVFVQALLIISMSGAADHGNYRKALLLSFAFTGSLATMLFVVVVPKVYLVGALLAIISNTCFGASFVLLNSFLPLLVRHHPSIQIPLRNNSSGSGDPSQRRLDESSVDDYDPSFDRPSAALLASSQVNEPMQKAISGINKPASPELQLSTKISAYGIGIGYIAALVVQTLAILIVLAVRYFSSSNTLSLRIVLFFVGLWWFSFTIPAALWLRPRPGPPLLSSGKAGHTRSWVGYVAYAWRSLARTVLRARRLKDVVLFLAAWFLLSDGIATVSGTAILFAKTQLKMEPPALALINVVATLSGVVGAFSWRKISTLFGIRPSQTILVCICLFEVIPLYGLVGYIPAVRRYGVFGLQQPWETYMLGALYGFVISGLSSYCRSLFGEIIPPGSEAAFYALYAITDKGSSVFGPAIVGAITDKYGEIRPAFVFLAVLIFLPLPLMMLVDVDRGRQDGAAMAKDLQAKGGYPAQHTGRNSLDLSGDEEVESLENRHD